MTVASKPQKRSPLHRYSLTDEQVEIIVDAVEMRRAYLAIAVSEVSSSEMDDVARDLAAMDSLLDRLRRRADRSAASRRHEGRLRGMAPAAESPGPVAVGDPLFTRSAPPCRPENAPRRDCSTESFIGSGERLDEICLGHHHRVRKTPTARQAI